MELYQLKTFVKVADTGNLTRASEALFTSQPAISAQIKALEDELGLALFSRTPKGMVLTESGKRLYGQAKQTLQAADLIKAEAQSLRNEVVADLKVGIHTDFEFMLTGKLYQQLFQQHPKIALHFLQTASAKVVQQLRTGELDASFMFGPCPAADVAVTELAQVPLSVVGPAGMEDITAAELDDLYESHWIYTTANCPFYKLFDQVFQHHQGKPSRITWADSEDAIRELVKAGAGFSVLRTDDADRLVRQGFATLWPGHFPPLELNFVCLKQRQHEAAIQAFAQCVQENWDLPDLGHQSIA